VSHSSLVARLVAPAALLACWGCNGATPTTSAASTAPGSTAKPSSPGTTTPPAPVGSNAVTVGQVYMPSTLYSGQNAAIYVTVTNTGAATWDDTYQLGVVGDTSGDAYKFLNDPQLLQVYPSASRVHLYAGTTVPTGTTYLFGFVVKAPAPGTYDLKFQMVQDSAGAWFGPVVEQQVTVGPALAPGTVPPDGVDLSQATVYNSPPDIASWPATTAVTQFEVNQAMQILFTKRDGANSWPDYTPPGFGGPIEYTLWSVELVGGQWATSGVIQIWRDPSDTLWSGGLPSGIQQNWYYDPGRWGPLASHQPAVGEPIGFFVSAGNARNDPTPGATSVLERSNVILIPCPPDSPTTTFTWP
jgi:hypothetical protein